MLDQPSKGVAMKLGRMVSVVVAALALGAVAPSAAVAKPSDTRDVLVVSNNWEGTADLVDPRTFERLKRINVIPDAAERLAEIQADPVASFFFQAIRTLIGEGHDQYVDDGFTSPDGKVVYFSRPSFADVVAIDLNSGETVWRTRIDGYRADHMALSEDGRRLLVSASTANVVDVIDTRSGDIVGRIPSGDRPTRATSPGMAS
jgi:WD40 repeat protein